MDMIASMTRDVIARGPDDTRSGRGNDTRRAILAARMQWLDSQSYVTN